MKKISFLIVGSGWRSMYYVRIARALPQLFEVCAMLCRTKEKARRIEEDYHIKTSLSEEECEAMHPDFIVVRKESDAASYLDELGMSEEAYTREYLVYRHT